MASRAQQLFILDASTTWKTELHSLLTSPPGGILKTCFDHSNLCRKDLGSSDLLERW